MHQANLQELRGAQAQAVQEGVVHVLVLVVAHLVCARLGAQSLEAGLCWRCDAGQGEEADTQKRSAACGVQLLERKSVVR